MFLLSGLILTALFFVAVAHRDAFIQSAGYVSTGLKLCQNCSYKIHCKEFPRYVNARGLLLLLLLSGDISVNPGPVLGVLNIRSVRNKGALIADATASHGFDFLCLSETHIRSTDSDNFIKSIAPKDYIFLHRARLTGLGGGVGFLIKQLYHPKKIESPFYRSFENMVVSVSVPGRTLMLACVYRPPGSCTFSFLEDFMSFVVFLSAIDHDFYICGDFNLHVDVPGGDGGKFLSLLETCNLSQSVTQPTHLHGHILDLILSPNNQHDKLHVKICEFISDHAIIKCTIVFPPPVVQMNQVTFRKYHRIDMTAFKIDLKNSSFVKHPASTVSELLDQYVNDLSSILETHAPLVSKVPTKLPAQWMSEDFRLAKALRRQFERTWRKMKTPLNRSRLRCQISRCNRLANNDRAAYYKSLITDNSHDSRKLWRELNKVLNRTPSVTLPVHRSEKSLADKFASFFNEKIAKIRDSFDPSDTKFTTHPPYDPPSLTTFAQVSVNEVKKIILASPTKSCLLDPLPTFLVKDCLDVLLPSITKLVNYSLSEGLVPTKFKQAVVTPLIKKSSLPADELKSYRPVSGLSFMSKLVERVVAKQLTEHIHAHNLDNAFQSAYKAGNSTETALLSMKNDIHLSLARGEPSALVLLDLSAAFDTIDHSTLLSRLQTWFGVTGSVLDWFSSYLQERYQSIKIGSTLSEACRLLFGVPQGSVLGPLLFSLYTSPLNSIIGRHKGIGFHFYADDTQLYVHLNHKNAPAAFDSLNNCLNDVKEWMATNKLKLNASKTEFIILGNKRQRSLLEPHLPVNILGNLLQPSESVRNLGVWFDADFSFSKHVQNVCKGCFAQLRDFRRVRRYLTTDASILVANALVSSRLDYCNSLFRSLSKFNLHKLHAMYIQNSAARIVSNTSKFTSISPIHRALHWLPLESHSIFKTANLVYRFLQTGTPKYF